MDEIIGKSQNLKKLVRVYTNDLKSNKTKRITYIDIARGIAIILMIAGHVCSFNVKRAVIFSFHMPLFIIVSGMFFKEKENLKNLIINILKKLILPYIIVIFSTNIIKIVFWE